MTYYASVFRAELGWKVVLVDSEGSPHIIDVKHWGLMLDCKLIPLDDEMQSLKRHNYLCIIDPNYPPTDWSSVVHMAKEKAKEPGWAENFVISRG